MGLHYGVDLARMYTTTTGTGNVTLTTAVPGCKTFAASGISDSDTVNYGIITYDLTTHRPLRSETGLGKYIASGTILQRNTVLHSTDSDDSAIDLTGLSEVYIPFLQKDILRVKESDSDPNVYPVNTIIVSNGSLTDNGNGVVTVTTGAGGGSGSPFALYENTSLPQDTINNAASADPMTLDTEVVDADGLFTLSANVLTCGVSGLYYLSIGVYMTDATTFGNGSIYCYLSTNTANTSPQWFPALTVPTTVDSAADEMFYSFAGPIRLTANDTIWFTMDNASGGQIQAAITEVLITKLSS